MTEEVRLSKKDLRRLEKAAKRVDRIASTILVDRLGGAVGRIEGAFSLALEKIDTIARFLTIEKDSEEFEDLRETLEIGQARLSGFERGLEFFSAVGAFVPGGEVVLGGAGAVLGSEIGRDLAEGQRERRRLLRRSQVDLSNLLFRERVEASAQIEATRRARDGAIERARREAAHRRALGSR